MTAAGGAPRAAVRRPAAACGCRDRVRCAPMADPALGWALVAAGGAGQAVGLVLARRALRELARGGRAVGRIVGHHEAMVERAKGAPRRFHFPVIEFRTASGEVATFRAATGRLAPAPLGTAVPVAYDPQHPARARLATFAATWAFPLLASLASLPFLVAGLFVLSHG